MKKLMKKTVFGVPIGTILLGAMVIGVAAAFLLSINASVNLSAAQGPTGNIEYVECTLLAGAGTINTCTYDGFEVTVSADGLDNESVLEVNTRYNTEEDQIYQFVPPDPVPAGVASITSDVADGTAVVKLGTFFRVNIDLSDLQSGQVVDPFVFSHTFSAAPAP
jgi:FlaG/FlaF family flagellin (archaellin)